MQDSTKRMLVFPILISIMALIDWLIQGYINRKQINHTEQPSQWDEKRERWNTHKSWTSRQADRCHWLYTATTHNTILTLISLAQSLPSVVTHVAKLPSYSNFQEGLTCALLSYWKCCCIVSDGDILRYGHFHVKSPIHSNTCSS